MEIATSPLFKTLNISDINAYLELQDKILPSTLREDGTCSIKPRDQFYMHAHMAAKMPVLGAVDKNGTLLAGALVTYPDHPAALHKNDYPFTELLSEVFIIQGLYVAPEAQGKGHSMRLVREAFVEAAKDGRKIAYAKYAHDRKGSEATFIKAHFEKVGSGIDPVHGHAVDFVRREEARLLVKRSAREPFLLPNGSAFAYA